MPDLNQAGSIASLIAFAVLVLGGISRIIKLYRETRAKENTEAKEFAEWLSSIVDESSTSASRSDAAAFIQHVMDRHRHLVTTLYLRILIMLTVGVGGFLVFKAVSLNFIAWQFLSFGISMSCGLTWFLMWAKKLVKHAEYEVGSAWAKQIDKARNKKRKNG